MEEPTAPSLLTKIPLEVLLRVTRHLTTPELGNFRLTCRGIETSLYNTFVDEFFSQKQFMVADFSLRALVDISKSRLGCHLQRLQIGTDLIQRVRPRQDPGYWSLLSELRASQYMFWNSGVWKQMLIEALGSLVNLKEVVIRDCNSKSRHRDGPPGEWRSYGYPTIERSFGDLTYHQPRHDQHRWIPVADPGSLFVAVLFALAESRSPAQGIEVICRYGRGLEDQAFCVTASEHGLLTPTLSKLEKLHLQVYEAEIRDVASSRETMMYGEPLPYDMLERFLYQVPNLKDLRINGNPIANVYASLISYLLDRLSEPMLPLLPLLPDEGLAKLVSSPVSPPKVLLPNLQDLSLGVTTLEPRSIIGFLQRLAPSLRSLELWKVALWRAREEGQDGQDEQDMRRPLWPSLLRELTSIEGLELRHLKIGCPSQQTGRNRYEIHTKVKVTFKRAEEEGELATEAYTGPDYRHFVRDLAKRVNTHWPKAGDTSVHIHDVYQYEEHIPEDEDESDSSDGDGNEDGDEDMD